MKKRNVLAMLLAVVMLATCIGSLAEAAPTAEGPDISEKVEIKMVLVGEKPNDADVVFGKISDMLGEDINATLKIEYLSLADYTQMYSLMLASGEPIDAIYTSTWCYFMEESSKGAFKAIDEEFIATYMPLHEANMPAVAFQQAKVDGSTYMVPANYNTISGYAVLIRGDLRKKYGMDEVTTLEQLEEYYTKVTENEAGMQAYAAAQNNNDMKFFLYNNQKRDIAKNHYFALYDVNGDSSTDMPDVRWLYGTEEYAEFAKLMKKWCDLGFWSKNAIANTANARDAFENGSAASLIWNIYTLGASAQTVMAKNPDWEPEIVDLFPEGGAHKRGLYTSDGFAFPISGNNSERAAMAIDLIKFDTRYYDLMRYGIEGEHWVNEGNNIWSPGSKQSDYTFDQITWGFKNIDMERVNVNEYAPIVEVRERWYTLAPEWNILDFTLNESEITTEMAALNNLFSKYVFLMDLGAVEDVDATLAEFNAQAEAVGLQKVMDELEKQIKQYYIDMGK